MQVNDIKAKTRGKFKIKSRAQILHVAPNLLKEDFSCNKHNEKWGTDISYIRIAFGWLYLAVIIDLFSRKVVGMSISNKMGSNLVIKALYGVLDRGPITLGKYCIQIRAAYTAKKDFKINLIYMALMLGRVIN